MHSSYYDYNNGGGGDEYAAAVAAAAFAIRSLESPPPLVRPHEHLEQLDLKPKPRRIVTWKTRSRKDSKSFETQRFDEAPESSKTKHEDGTAARSGSYQRRPSRRQSRDTDWKMPEKVIHPVLSRKRTLSISSSPDQGLDETRRTPVPLPSPPPPALHPPPILQPPPPPPPPPDDFRKFRVKETEADLWERAELERIREKYDKLNASIIEWEDKKKKKAKRKLDAIEEKGPKNIAPTELQQRRVKALQHYQTEMERVNEIAGGAKARAIQKQRKEELKVKDKADKFRITGKLPPTCLCF